MTQEKAAPPASTDNDYAWFREGSVPKSREDRIAEAVALVALLFSLGIGVVIALLPVQATAAMPGARTAHAMASPLLRPSARPADASDR
jgi:hypothetical protein